MSAINTNETIINHAVHTIVGRINTLWLRYRQYRLYRRTIAEMQRMSPRDLADFGLSRCEIDHIAHSCVYGDSK